MTGVQPPATFVSCVYVTTISQYSVQYGRPLYRHSARAPREPQHHNGSDPSLYTVWETVVLNNHVNRKRKEAADAQFPLPVVILNNCNAECSNFFPRRGHAAAAAVSVRMFLQPLPGTLTRHLFPVPGRSPTSADFSHYLLLRVFLFWFYVY